MRNRRERVAGDNSQIGIAPVKGPGEENKKKRGTHNISGLQFTFMTNMGGRGDSVKIYGRLKKGIGVEERNPPSTTP